MYLYNFSLAAVTPTLHLRLCIGVTIVHNCSDGSNLSTVLKIDNPSCPPNITENNMAYTVF